jgi:hypothetical protein
MMLVNEWVKVKQHFRTKEIRRLMNHYLLSPNVKLLLLLQRRNYEENQYTQRFCYAIPMRSWILKKQHCEVHFLPPLPSRIC